MHSAPCGDAWMSSQVRQGIGLLGGRSAVKESVKKRVAYELLDLNGLHPRRRLTISANAARFMVLDCTNRAARFAFVVIII